MVEKCYFCNKTVDEFNAIIVNFIDEHYDELSKDPILQSKIDERKKLIADASQYREVLRNKISEAEEYFSTIISLDPSFVKKYEKWDENKYSVAKEIGFAFDGDDEEKLCEVLSTDTGKDVHTVGEIYYLVIESLNEMKAKLNAEIPREYDKESFIKDTLKSKYHLDNFEQVETVRINNKIRVSVPCCPICASMFEDTKSLVQRFEVR